VAGGGTSFGGAGGGVGADPRGESAPRAFGDLVGEVARRALDSAWWARAGGMRRWRRCKGRPRCVAGRPAQPRQGSSGRGTGRGVGFFQAGRGVRGSRRRSWAAACRGGNPVEGGRESSTPRRFRNGGSRRLTRAFCRRSGRPRAVVQGDGEEHRPFRMVRTPRGLLVAVAGAYGRGPTQRPVQKDRA